MTLQIPAALADAIITEARAQGLPVEDYLTAVLRRDRLAAERRAIEQEQAWWLSRPLSERARYEGQYIAVVGHQVIDSDADHPALRRRIRARFGRRPVLLMPAEGPRDISVVSPRIVSP